MLTIKTPYKELRSEFLDDFEKCAYWVDKEMRRDRNKFDALMRSISKPLNHKLPFIDYKSKNGNRWRNYCYYSGNNGIMAAMRYDSFCYWETYGSFGAFTQLKFDGIEYIAIFPGHFWQRLCERDPRFKMKGVHTCEEFFADHRAMAMKSYDPKEGDDRRTVAVFLNGFSAYGVVVSEEYRIVELRTIIPNDQLSGDKRREAQDAIIASEKEKAAHNEIMAMLTMSRGLPLYTIINRLSPFARDIFVKRINQMSEDEFRLAFGEPKKEYH